MTEDEAVELMQMWIDELDVECAHREADDVLIQFLEANGFTELSAAWKKVKKWYA